MMLKLFINNDHGHKLRSVGRLFYSLEEGTRSIAPGKERNLGSRHPSMTGPRRGPTLGGLFVIYSDTVTAYIKIELNIS